MYLHVAADGSTVLACSPDTAERDEPWRWTLRLDDGAVSVDVADGVIAEQSEHVAAVTLHRAAGTLVAVVGISGSCEVRPADGPWARDVGPGDLFVAEDDRAEPIALQPADDTTRVTVVVMRNADGTALRWVP